MICFEVFSEAASSDGGQALEALSHVAFEVGYAIDRNRGHN